MKSREQKRQEAQWRTLVFEYVNACYLRDLYNIEVREGECQYHPDDLRYYLRKWRQAKTAFEQGVPLEQQQTMLAKWFKSCPQPGTTNDKPD